MKRISKYVLFHIFLTAMLFAISCHRSSISTEVSGGSDSGEVVITKAQFESSGMRLGSPESRVFQQKISANGYVVAKPEGTAQISTMIPGRVMNMNLSVGDYVKKGQQLFTLESNEVILLQQEYAEAHSQLIALKANYERQRALAREQISSQKELINAESHYRTTLARAEGLKARLVMLHIQPSQVENGAIVPVVTIYAPIGGYVTRTDMVLGQFIEPQHMVMEVVNTNELRLNIHLFMKDLKDLEIGQLVRFHEPGDRSRVLEAKISQIGRSIDPDSKTVMCFAQMTGTDQSALVNNLFIEAEIITCFREAPAIPSEALILEEGRYYVLQLADEKEDRFIFKRIPVDIGVVTIEYAEVLDEGLEGILLEEAYHLSGGDQ